MDKSTRPVLIIAAAAEAHALAVAARLEAEYGCDCFIWDSPRYPVADHIVQEMIGNGQTIIALESAAVGRIDLVRFRSIWWRRPVPPRIPEEAGPVFIRDYCRRKSSNFLHGVLSASDVPIFNDPAYEQRAERRRINLRSPHRKAYRCPKHLSRTRPKM